MTITALLEWRDAINEGRILLRDVIDLEATQGGAPGEAKAAMAANPPPPMPRPAILKPVIRVAPPPPQANGEATAEGTTEGGEDDDENALSLSALEEKLKPEVLRTLPGMTEEGVFLLTSRRDLRPLHNADELAGLLSRSSRAVFLGSYAEFVRAAVFGPPQLIVTVEGSVRGTPIVARATLTTVPVPGRLAVIRRETE